MDTEKFRSTRQFRITVIGSMLATSVALLSELSTVSDLDKQLLWVSQTLAFSLPLLSVDIFLTLYELFLGKKNNYQIFKIIRLLAIVAFIVALIFFFFHFSELAGIIFIFAGILGLFLYVPASSSIKDGVRKDIQNSR